MTQIVKRMAERRRVEIPKMMKESAEGMTIGNSGPPDGLGRFTSKSRFALGRREGRI
jgi:hypothetical protein